MTRAFSLLAAVFLGLSVVAPAAASPLDFSFSFSSGALVVEGTVFGLEDNTLGQAATSLIVESSPGDKGLGEYVNAFAVNVFSDYTNSFSVVGGEIVFADFLSVIAPTSALFLEFPGSGDSNIQAAGLLVVGQVDFAAVPVAVPLPASLPLLLGGLAGVALLRRRRARLEAPSQVG